MASKTATRAAHGRVTAPGVESPERIRNVVLVGPCGAGKTTLLEQLLAASGAITHPGSVGDGTTVSDSDPVEVAQQRSVFLAAGRLRHGDVLMNLLDAPGFADFVGEVRAGLRAADGALFVVSAADSLDESTVALWEECVALQMPRAVVVNRLDAPLADLAGAVRACREAFGDRGGNAVVARYLPDAADPTRLVDLLASEVPEVAAERAELIEAIIAESEDEQLLDSYLDGDQLDPALLSADMHKAVARGHFHPVAPVCAATGLGLAELLDLIAAGFPSPTEVAQPAVSQISGEDTEQLRCDPDGPLAGEVVRTWVDPYLGRVALARLFSGTIRPDTPLHVSGHGGESRGHPDHDLDERAATLLGVDLNPVDAAFAGELCVVARLANVETGDTISAQDRPLVIQPWAMPEPLLPIAVRGATRNDEDALAKALGRLLAADPVLRVERNSETGQLVLWCLGEAHADVVLSRLRGNGADIEAEPVRVALRATFTTAAQGHGRHVKQSGGHGQYAICDVLVEPLPRGSGVEFVDKVVGGAVPNQFIGSVEKGARAQLARGVVGSVPVVDVRVSLLDGKAHSVDSSDAAFQAAGALAVRDAAEKGKPQYLEPVDAVEITVTDDHIGAVLSDLSARRARVTGSEPFESARPGARTVIRAEVPAAELVRYAAALRSLTGGAGVFHRRYLRHDPAPASVAAVAKDDRRDQR